MKMALTVILSCTLLGVIVIGAGRKVDSVATETTILRTHYRENADQFENVYKIFSEQKITRASFADGKMETFPSGVTGSANDQLKQFCEKHGIEVLTRQEGLLMVLPKAYAIEGGFFVSWGYAFNCGSADRAADAPIVGDLTKEPCDGERKMLYEKLDMRCLLFRRLNDLQGLVLPSE